MIQLLVGQRVKFLGEKRSYTVQAVSRSGRWIVCTKPFAARHTVLYTMLDLQQLVRGVDDSLGNSLGYETRADCEEAVRLFEDGEFSFSCRRKPIPLCFERIENPKPAQQLKAKRLA